MEESNVSIRLKHFVDSTGLTSSQFADACGIPRPSLSQLINGRNKKISDVVVKLIHDRFPELSVLWLMFGEGDMYNPTALDHAHSSDNSEMLSTVQGEYENQNLRELNQPVFNSNFQSNSTFNSSENLYKSEAKKCENQIKPRKVISITVFYDDNSYETFSPSK